RHTRFSRDWSSDVCSSDLIKLKDLKQGDQLFDENGAVCNVTKLHPINYSPESYRITFDDGTIVDACAEHLWATYTEKNRNITIKNTKEIINSFYDLHFIPLIKQNKDSIIKYSEKLFNNQYINLLKFSGV